MKKQFVAVALVGILVGSLLPTAIHAQQADDDATDAQERQNSQMENNNSQTELQQNALEQRDLAAQRQTEAQEQANKLAARKKICESRIAQIQRLISNLQKIGEGNMTVLDSLSTRVQEFYREKQLRIGNYSTLTTAIRTAHDKAMEKLVIVRSSPPADCSSDNPRAAIDTYRTNYTAFRQAMQDYRSSIKNLLLSVKQALVSAKEAR
jgi:chromosome segregation ATPase